MNELTKCKLCTTGNPYFASLYSVINHIFWVHQKEPHKEDYEIVNQDEKVNG